jgi:hypothetical protein
MKTAFLTISIVLFFSSCATDLTIHNSNKSYTNGCLGCAIKVKSKAIGPGSRDQDKYVAEVKHF